MIEVHLDLDGYPVTLLDTAGIRDSDDPVEQEGVRRARSERRKPTWFCGLMDARKNLHARQPSNGDSAGARGDAG